MEIFDGDLLEERFVLALRERPQDQVSQIASVRLKAGCGYAYLVITAQPGDRSWISSFAERTLGRSPANPGSVQRPLPHGHDVMKANGGLSRGPAMLGTSGYALRPNGQYCTPTWVTEALLSRVGFRGVIWEPAAGAGDMVKPLRVAGYRVFPSELHASDLGWADAVHLDFLEAHSLNLDGAPVHGGQSKFVD